jgi:hypothetical protein
MRKPAIVLGLSCVFLLGALAQGRGSTGDPTEQEEGGVAKARVRSCFAGTLKGVFGIKFEGQSLTGGPFVSVSRIVFDGRGHFTTSEIGRFNGNLVQRTFTGPYTVREDCTGFLDFSSDLSDPPHEARGELVIVDGGDEFFVLDNEDGWAASGVGKRL